MGQLVVLKVDHLEGLMEGRWVDQKVVLMEGRLVDLMVVRKVDHLGGLMEGRLVGRKVDHLGGLMEGRLVGRKVDHLEDLMVVRLVDRKVDHLGVLRGPAVAKEVSLLYERLVLLEPVQVVQLVVKEEMEQARIVPA